MDAHQSPVTVTATTTRYAAIHPRFPVQSLAQVWVKELPEALSNAADLQSLFSRPVTVMVRTEVRTTTFEEVVAFPATSPELTH